MKTQYFHETRSDFVNSKKFFVILNSSFPFVTYGINVLNFRVLIEQAYHSSLRDYQQVIGNIAVMPIKTKFRGPAHNPLKVDADDIIDETLAYFKANVFFRTYEIKVRSLKLDLM